MARVNSTPFPKIASFLIFSGFFVLTGCFQDRVIVLKGTVVTPEKVLEEGWVAIEKGRIRSVTAWDPKVLFSKKIDTQGIIYPGLIDLHSHIASSIFPLWEPEKKYKFRFEWQRNQSYYTEKINPRRNRLSRRFDCERNIFGEVRSLVGGTTSVYGARRLSCLEGLVRNLSFSSGFYNPPEKDADYVIDQLRLQLYDPQKTRVQKQKNLLKRFEGIREDLAEPKLKAFLVHAGEGHSRNHLAKKDFHILLDNGFLTPKTAIVHGVSFGPVNMQKIKEAGSSLIWSPKSNLNLYGDTLDVPLAKALGITMALSSDWALTGSGNLLAEVNFAWNYANEVWPSLFSEKDFFDMTTSIPAKILGIEDKIGHIQNGNYADLLILKGDSSQPFKTFVQAQPKQINLVFINGVPHLGPLNS